MNYWVTLSAERILWLPPEYRPGHWIHRNGALVIASGTRKQLCFIARACLEYRTRVWEEETLLHSETAVTFVSCRYRLAFGVKEQKKQPHKSKR